nr:YheC/YheD family protein [Desulfolucanica intricata]
MQLMKILEDNNHLVLAMDKDFSPHSNFIFWGTRCEVIYNKDLNLIKFINNSYNPGNLNYVRIFSDEAGQTRIGPLLGMLISSSKKERILQGYKDSVYIKLTDYMRNIGGILVFFTINDVDWNGLLVNGHILDTGNYTYVPVCVPLPRVVYDRCFGSNGRIDGFIFREKASGLDIKIFNAMVKLGKLDTYDILSKDTELQKITLPYSEFSMNKLIQFMEQYDSVYVKPDQLYKGEGLIKVTKNSTGYCIEHHRDKVFTKVETGDLNYVLGLMEDFGQLSQKYVIQKSIDIALFLGNPFDVRVMLQKNDLGDWEVTGALARVGPEDCLITSPRSGGKVIRLRDAVSSAFPGQSDKQEQIIESIEQYTKKIGCFLEEKNNLIGELGIDLGIDKQGNIWLIEVNAKPLRVSMKKLKSKPVDTKINSYPCLFGAFLDGFSLNNKEIRKTTDVCEHIMKLIEISSLPPLTIRVGKNQIDFLNINPDKPVMLKIGAKEVIARVQISESQPINQIGISPDIMTETGCYSDIQIKLISSVNNIIWLGPLFAIMTPINNVKTEVEDKEIEYMEKIAYELGCLLFQFTVQDINWSDKKMLGTFFNREKSKWEEKWFPFPDIVFDLSTFPRKDLRKRAKEILKQLNKGGTTVLINNRRYFGKYETMEAMSFFNQTKDFIPETHEFTRQNLCSLFQKCRRVYIKSEYGSHGD